MKKAPLLLKRDGRGGFIRRGGYTLVEVMIAVAILAIAIASFLALLTHGFRVLRDTRRYQIANGLLTQEMERMRALPFSTIVTQATTWTPAVAGYTGRRTNSQSKITTTNVLRLVQISVIWTNRTNKPVTNSLTTLVAAGGLNPP